MKWIKALKYDTQGLIPALIQDWTDGEVLMMAWMNEQTLCQTLRTGKTHFWSRSRRRAWMKGEQSGHIQRVKQLAYDCDKDCLLIKVEQIGGAACHTGHRSCFFTVIQKGKPKEKGKMLFDPKKVYQK